MTDPAVSEWVVDPAPSLPRPTRWQRMMSFLDLFPFSPSSPYEAHEAFLDSLEVHDAD